MREKHSFAGYWYGSVECDYVHLKDEFHGYETKYGKLKRERYPLSMERLPKRRRKRSLRDILRTVK